MLRNKIDIIIKGVTIFFVFVIVLGMFLIAYQLGFELENEDLGRITLNNLTGVTYNLMFSGIILSTIALGLLLISASFGHKLLKFDKILWGGAMFFLLGGVILLGTGEAYFASKNEVNQIVSDVMIFLSMFPGLGTVAMMTVVFIKEKKDNDLNNEIIVKQVNSKLRLFLLICCNWYFTAAPFLVPFCILLVPIETEHGLLWTILIIFCFLFLLPFYSHFIMGIGIKYLPKDLYEYYTQKNSEQLQKIKGLEIKKVNQLFDVIPICDEAYSKKTDYEIRTKREFKRLSWIEASTNRLVVNGKINNLDFSWGVVMKMKKKSFKVFLLAILYFGPIAGIFIGLFPQMIADADFFYARWTWHKINDYKKLGGLDLFPYHVGRLNSENYLIFSAKLKNQSDLISLIPKNDDQIANLDFQYEWLANISGTQKIELQNLIKEMPFLPSIYLYQDQISIVMKKYCYNEQDNQELQNWELLNKPQTDNSVQFNYLNQAVKIYHIFNERE